MVSRLNILIIYVMSYDVFIKIDKLCDRLILVFLD